MSKMFGCENILHGRCPRCMGEMKKCGHMVDNGSNAYCDIGKDLDHACEECPYSECRKCISVTSQEES